MLEGKRKYPEVNASLFRWILGILVCYGSLLVSSLIIFLFNIENLIIPALIMSFLSIMGALIIDKNILRKLFLFLNFKDVIFVFVGLIISFIFIIFASFAATYFKIGGEVNPIFGLLDKFSKSEFLISSAIQFIGEELMFVLPFLFVINKFKKTPKIIRVFLAVIISSLLFGALHIPTYNFNIVQALVLIGIVRTGITITYIFRKNLTVSYIVHFLYDWIIILMAIKYSPM